MTGKLTVKTAQMKRAVQEVMVCSINIIQACLYLQSSFLLFILSHCLSLSYRYL